MSIKSQALRFIIVGVAATLSDAGTYVLLMEGLDFPVSPSKALAFIIGTTVSYVLNKQWTFQHKGSSDVVIKRFLILYGVTLVFNVMVNKLVINACLDTSLDIGLVKTVAYVLATATSTILNFIGSRHWVFR